MDDRVESRAGDVVLGLDIGGANLKAASSDGKSSSLVFPMWQAADGLTAALVDLGRRVESDPQRVAVTMTGELADCFATRSEGVAAILGHVESAFSELSVWVYRVDGAWSGPAAAKADPWSVAASNWHAAASFFAGQLHSKSLREHSVQEAYERAGRQAILIDIGSTTVDVIPIANGQVVTESKTDRDRLMSRELVYTGVERTPVASLLNEFQIGSERVPVMRERFADSSDAHLLLGITKEEPANLDTADGRPRTVEFACARMARMIGEDGSTLSENTAIEMAEQTVAAQLSLICEAVEAVGVRYFGSLEPTLLLFSGHAGACVERIVRELGATLEFADVSAVLGAELSRCAPAYAVARLCAAME